MDKAKAGYFEGFISIGVNSALFALKLWAGILTNSLALTADAWHTFSDSLSSLILIIGVKLSSKKADREHPFGHGRIEHITSLFIAFFLGLIAYEFLKTAAGQFIRRESPVYGKTALAVTSLSIIAKELLAQYAFSIARKTQNPSVRADGWHHRSDALSSVGVLAGLLFGKNLWWIDSALGGAIAFLLFYTAYGIIKASAAALLGEEPDQNLIDQITEEVKGRYNQDLALHHFHIHNYVTHKELTLHIRLDKTLSIDQGHSIATDIEHKIAEKFGIIATVHVEPN
ncbi:MAG: cation diffusion facilitator family transporter [Spirochaetaceae bacterium]|jgi:cation diffusion facilitator family transporter|nr:cation diffusion facilitator family transporter [Spirochaetaceae bacterium]